MPLPSPKPGEEEDAWISRCMGNEAMKGEFPDNKQRQAVCQQKWRDKDKRHMTAEELGVLLGHPVYKGDYSMSEAQIDHLREDIDYQLGRDKGKKSMRTRREAAAARWNENMDWERRSGPQGELRVAEDDDGKMTTIIGYAAVFGELSEEMTGPDDTGRWRKFRERIAPGAFKRSLADGDDVKANVDHESGLQTIGRTTNGTLELREDDRGLAVTITPPDTQAGRDVVELVRRGDVNQMSFAFKMRGKGASWEEGEEDIAIRTVKDTRLFDVAIVTYPAYPQTSVAVRSLNAWRSEQSKAAANQRERHRRLLRSYEEPYSAECATGGFATFREYLLTARRAAMSNGAHVDNRLEELPVTGLSGKQREEWIKQCDDAIEEARNK